MKWKLHFNKIGQEFPFCLFLNLAKISNDIQSSYRGFVTESLSGFSHGVFAKWFLLTQLVKLATSTYYMLNTQRNTVGGRGGCSISNSFPSATNICFSGFQVYATTNPTYFASRRITQSTVLNSSFIESSLRVVAFKIQWCLTVLLTSKS